mgnify:CR=1 FL=1
MKFARVSQFALLAAALCLNAARAGESVTVNDRALDRLPPKESARGITAPPLIPPSLIQYRHTLNGARIEPAANLPTASTAVPEAFARKREPLYNDAAATLDEEMALHAFARPSASLSQPKGLSAATPGLANQPQLLAANNANDEPVFISWAGARTIGEILFRANGDALKDIASASIPELDQLAHHIGSAQIRVLLRAFGGTSGDDSHEAHRVALHRALAVRKYLIARGVPSTCIDVNAMGGARDGGTSDRVDVLESAI